MWIFFVGKQSVARIMTTGNGSNHPYIYSLKGVNGDRPENWTEAESFMEAMDAVLSHFPGATYKKF